MSIETIPTVPSPELPNAEFLFGETAAMQGIRERVEQAFGDDLPVLIEGECGTGKEVISRFLHKHSLRKAAPFLKLNCAASSADSMEKELYGSGGARVRTMPSGAAGLASGGTLFFDEIGDMDLTLQRTLGETVVAGRYRSPACSGLEAVDARFVYALTIDLRSTAQDQGILEPLL